MTNNNACPECGYLVCHHRPLPDGPVASKPAVVPLPLEFFSFTNALNQAITDRAMAEAITERLNVAVQS